MRGVFVMKCIAICYIDFDRYLPEICKGTILCLSISSRDDADAVDFKKDAH